MKDACFCLRLLLCHLSFSVLFSTKTQQGSQFSQPFICHKKGGFFSFPQPSTILVTTVFFVVFWEFLQLGDFFSENEKALFSFWRVFEFFSF
jgi:hypothetical protein